MTEAKKSSAKKAPAKKAEPKGPKLVNMVRDDGREASVHPDEVASYIKGNYREV